MRSTRIARTVITRPFVAALLFGLACSSARAEPPARPEGAIRIATFNASLNRDKPGQLLADLGTPDNVQARNVAEVIQRVRPDILLINEFDHDPDGKAAALFQTNYLARGQNGAEPIAYAYRYTDGVNTGVASGVDLDHDGRVASEPGSRGYGNDAFGFGLFPGQYGMVVYSNFPIDTARVRSFRTLRWADMPDALLPTRPDGSMWYGPEALRVFRLSSKSHWDVPVTIGSQELHLLVSHPTPPAFDGPEDRNGKRNHDEIRIWADYLTGGPRADYLRKALPAGSSITPPETFVILGDLNSDPHDGGSVANAVGQLLRHPRVNPEPIPTSEGAAEASKLQGGRNAEHRGDPAQDTADFADSSVGNLRADYVLPSRNLVVLGSGVFWPRSDDPLARLVAMTPAVSTSDHRLVYIDVRRP